MHNLNSLNLLQKYVFLLIILTFQYNDEAYRFFPEIKVRDLFCRNDKMVTFEAYNPQTRRCQVQIL